VCLSLVSRFIEDPAYLVRENGYLDWPGLGLLVAGLGGLQLMLEEGERNDWFQSGFIVRLGIVAAVGLALFVWRELTTERPAVNLRILGNISFASATALGGVLGLALTASLFLLPVFLQNLLGFNAMQSGLTLMPRSLAMAVLMPVAGRFYNRLGPRILVGSGLLIGGVAFYSMSKLTTSVGYWDLFWPQLWQGVGFSLIFVALSTAALSTIARPNMTAATGLYNVVRQVMGSVGIAIAATTLSTTTARYHAILSEDAGASIAGRQWLDALAKGMMAKGADAFTAAAQAMRVLDGLISRQASVLAYNHVFVLVSSLLFIGFPLVFLLRRGSPDAEVEIAVD
jgi:DHA2 family multidrug resistance protein